MAKGSVKIKGFKEVKANLNKEIRKIKGRTLKGLIEAQIAIRRDMEVSPPTVPVDTRNLDYSYFAVASSGSVAGGTASFEGKEAGKMQSDHTTAIASAQALVKAKRDPLLIMGFSANYATFVHEMGDDINWKRPGSGSKFFQKAIERNTASTLKIIADNAKIR